MSTIEWTDLGREAPCCIPSDVVTGHETPRATIAVEQREGGAASALAGDVRVGFAWPPKIVPTPPVLTGVLPPGDDFKVLRSVVGLDAVAVVNDLASTEWSAEHLRGDQAVLIDVTATVGHRMPTSLHEHVSGRCDRPAALPSRAIGAIPRAGIGHPHNVANGR